MSARPTVWPAAGRRHDRRQPRRRRPARGAALLVAMVLLAVVATLASGMVWQQWRAIQVETAERARAQAGLMLGAGIDFARLLLRTNQNDAQQGHKQLARLLEVPMAETNLRSLLAYDSDHAADLDLDVYISGQMADAQARYNLRNLVIDDKVAPAQLQVLERLCASAGVGAGVASTLADGLLKALRANDPAAAPMPQRLEDLVWLGLDTATIARLQPYVVLLPVPTPVNANTASREVLAAVVPGLDLGSADRLIRKRQAGGFGDMAAVSAELGGQRTLEPRDLDVRSSFFEVSGRLRMGDRVLQERALIERRPGLQVLAIQRQREAQLRAGTGTP